MTVYSDCQHRGRKNYTFRFEDDGSVTWVYMRCDDCGHKIAQAPVVWEEVSTD